MSESNLKQSIQEQMKTAMKAKDSKRLGAIRLILAAIKQVEVDERKELTNQDIQLILNKMVKQRRDSKDQYEKAGRPELAEQEGFEIHLIEEFLPPQLSEAEVMASVQQCIEKLGANGPKDMGKVMAEIRPQLQGRADMRLVSELIKKQLNQ